MIEQLVLECARKCERVDLTPAEVGHRLADGEIAMRLERSVCARREHLFAHQLVHGIGVLLF